MPPKTLIRNSSPDEVQLSEGSRVAERRRTRKSPGIKPEPTPSPIEPDPVLEAKPAPEASPAKKRAPAKTRGQPRLKPQAGVLPPGMATPLATEAPSEPPRAFEAAPAEPAPATVTPTPTPMPLIDAKDLWESDNPVKERLGTLRARNALLTEQIQRLQHPLMGRGK